MAYASVRAHVCDFINNNSLWECLCMQHTHKVERTAGDSKRFGSFNLFGVEQPKKKILHTLTPTFRAIHIFFICQIAFLT